MACSSSESAHHDVPDLRLHVQMVRKHAAHMKMARLSLMPERSRHIRRAAG